MKKIIKYIIIGICILLIGTIYLFSSANTHQDALTEAQISSLCDYFASNVSPDKELKAEGTSQAAVKIFGTREKNEFTQVYGCVSSGYYVKHKDKAYDISGFNALFMVDLIKDNDSVKVVKEYGDGVSTQSTLKAMPFRYRLKSKHYNPHDANGYCKVQKDADKKAEQVLGVPVEKSGSISFSGNKYIIFDIDKDGNLIDLEEGKLEDF